MKAYNPPCVNSQISREAIADSVWIRIEGLLGRYPRGLVSVSLDTASGEPSVIEVEALVDDEPFPTLYWLIEPALCYWLARLEASGVIAELQGEIDQSQALQEAMREDHAWYKAQRLKSMSPEVKAALVERGLLDAFEQKGVGGITRTDRVRCLHTWYASHLIKPNTIGSWLDAHNLYAFKGE